MSRSRLLSSPRSFLFSTGVTRAGSGIRLGFRPVDEGDAVNDCPGEMNFFMVITDISERKIMITFHNQSPVNCVISDIIFADGGLYSISVQSARGSLEPGKLACAIDTGTGDHHYLPGPDHRYGNHQIASCDTTAPDALQDGIKPNESLGIIFDLQAGITLLDVLGALSREKLNISLKLLDDAPGTAGILINEPNLGLSTSW
jgi:hypothetical protein